MAKPISKLLSGVSMERQLAIKAKTDAILAQIELQASVNESNLQGSIKKLK